MIILNVLISLHTNRPEKLITLKI